MPISRLPNLEANMLYLASFVIGALIGLLILHINILVLRYEGDLKRLSSRKLRDLHRSVTVCCKNGLRKKTFAVRVYLACIWIELIRRGEKL